MGKLLKQQRRGKGSPAYRAQSIRYKADLVYRHIDEVEKTGSMRAEVRGFVDDPARGALLMQVKYENNEEGFLLAPEGVAVGDELLIGAGSEGLKLGSVLPLAKMPDGAFIYNIELSPGDGGKFVRAPGTYATVVSHEKKGVLVILPSRKTVLLQSECRAQLGVVCGGGRLDKPLMKAGANFYKKHAQNRKWPGNRGVHMSAYTHPFGGKQHHKGRSSCVARGAPPGRKVGHLAARATGRRKGRSAGSEANKQ